MRRVETSGHPPGGLDPLHALHLFGSSTPLGIPDLPIATDAPDWLTAYTDWRADRRRAGEMAPREPGRVGVHCFLDDYRLESCWSKPDVAAKHLQGADFVLSPDFSLYRDHPLAIQLWNTYRSRWVGARWAELGLAVIPTISWSTEASYAFAFAGIPRGSVVAISTVGGRDAEAARLFALGYRAMLDAIEPARVLVYGERLPDEIASALVTTYPPRTTRLRRVRKG